MAGSAVTPIPDDRIESRVWRICAVVVIGSIMSILDTTMVNVALATLGRDLHSSIAQIQWVATGYLLALAAVIPVSGWAAHRFGAKRTYMAALALFLAGSMLCGLATSASELVIFRAIRGVGGGMILPLGQMMIAEAAGPKRMGRVMGVLAAPTMLAPILGPTIGGVILENVSWRWIFFVNLPVGAVALAAAKRILADGAVTLSRRLDLRGLTLMFGGLPLLAFGLAEIGSTGNLTSLKVLLPSAAGSVLIVLFVLHALRTENPLLDLLIYRRPAFATGASAMFTLGAAIFGMTLLSPLYWQNVRHESVIDTGLLVGPQGLGTAIAMPLAGRLAARTGNGRLALLGVGLITLATIPFGLIGARTSISWLCIALAVQGMGFGFAFLPVMSAAFASVERSELADAAPQLNVLLRVGGSLGIAVLAVVLQRALEGTRTPGSRASAYGTAYWVAAGLTAAAFVPCLLLRRAERFIRPEHPPDTSHVSEVFSA